MRSLRTIMASAAAVALVALAITIAPAVATNAPSAKGPDPSAQEPRSCLADHGVEVPDGDALALKRWLGQHRGDAAYRDAMEACRLAIATKPAGGGAVAQPNPSSD